MALKDHFLERYPTMVAATCSFIFVGVAIVPLILQLLKDSFGFRNSLVLFGAISWNLIAVGVCMKQPKCQRTNEISPSDNGIRNKVDDIEEEATQYWNITKIVWRIKSYFSIFIKHKNFTILATIQSLMFYLYLSWALFLVSVGRLAGLSPYKAVLLSTVGGCGGFLGTMSAAWLHHGNLINPYTSCFIPLLLNGFFLLGSALLRDFQYLLIVVFLSGYCFGLISSATFGLMPSVVCDYHFPQALAINYFLDGMMMQISGTFSGKIRILFVFISLILKLSISECRP